jgi:hypothetical protein
MNAWLGRLGPLALLSILSLGAPMARAHGSPRRYAEAIVVSGADLAPLAGAPAAELKVYLCHHMAWQPVLAQLDERDAASDFVAQEDGALDENDELAFLLGEAGEQRQGDDRPPGVSGDHPAVEVLVTDPLDDEFKAYFYVFWTSGGQAPAETSVISYDTQAAEIRSRAYTLGLARPMADGFVGYRRLSLYTDTDNLLDRLKIRATISTLIGEQTLTEEALASILPALGDTSIAPVITGPVRLVLDAAGERLAYPERVTLAVRLPANPTLPGGIPIEVKDVRVSLDFSPAAVPAQYMDANTAAGVPIDGQADAVAERPIPAWREIELEAGRAVLLSDVEAGAAGATVYYKDNSTADPEDTGDGLSYGDNGVAAANLEDFTASGFPGELVVLPVGRQLTAQQLSENLANPLVVTVTSGPAAPTATPGAATPTGMPVEPTPTVRPTAGVDRHPIFVPLALRGQAFER